MDRLNQSHTGSRIDLPPSIDLPPIEGPITSKRLLSPIGELYVAVLGFMGCGAAVILTASLLALSVR